MLIADGAIVCLKDLNFLRGFTQEMLLDDVVYVFSFDLTTSIAFLILGNFNNLTYFA